MKMRDSNLHRNTSDIGMAVEMVTPFLMSLCTGIVFYETPCVRDLLL